MVKTERSHSDTTVSRKTRKLTQIEKENLKAGNGERVKSLLTAFSTMKRQRKFIPPRIFQVSRDDISSGLPGNGYLISELIVAGYQKFMENDFWGLANAAVEVKNLMEHHGNSGLDISGHSRGSMTIGNAMESLLRDGNGQESLGDTLVRFFGPAYSAEKAAGMLYELSGGKQDTVYLQNHKDDLVGVLGGNPATYGTVPDNSCKIKEWINILKDSPTVHSCYGAASQGCNDSYGEAKTVGVKR